MRILILSQFYPPEVGATQTRIHHFARRLSEKGHRITVIAEFPNHPKGVIFPGYSPRLFRRATEDNLDVIRLWVYTSPRKGAIRRILFYFSYMIGATIAGLILARGRYDVVFATSPPLPVALAASLVARFKRRPFVMDVRDLWPAVGIVLGEIRGRAMVKVGGTHRVISIPKSLGDYLCNQRVYRRHRRKGDRPPSDPPPPQRHDP